LKTALSKIYYHPFYPVILWAVHLTLLATVVYFVDYYSEDQIENLLKKWVYWNLLLNAFFILAGIILCRQEIKSAFTNILNKKGIAPLALLILIFGVLFQLAPKNHRIFFDEDIYINTGQTMALRGQTGFCNYCSFEINQYRPQWLSYNKQPGGWPFLISNAFRLFGVDETYAFYLNNLILVATVLLIFFIIRQLTADDFSAFLSALIFATVPHNLMWANTAAAEPMASLFNGLVVFLLILFLQYGKNSHLFLLAVTLPLAVQIRTESIMILGFTIIMLFIFSPKTLWTRKLWTHAVLTATLLIPQILHLYLVNGYSWGAKGPKFALRYFFDNIGPNSSYFFSNDYFPVLMSVLAVIGLLMTRVQIRWRMMILIWFLCYWCVFLLFYAGSYAFGADNRFALLTFIPLAVLAALGAGVLKEKLNVLILNAYKISKGRKKYNYQNAANPIYRIAPILITLLVLFSFARFLPLIRQEVREGWQARYDHKYAKEFTKKIPRDSVVLSQVPAMFALWGQSAIQTYAGIEYPDLIEHLLEKYQGHVYFHYNYWCNTQSRSHQRLCRAIRNKYLLEEIALASQENYTYGLYRIKLKK
jgi:4-amino-4-deoxy-L-arabinose transferase-like glycosyltransferase